MPPSRPSDIKNKMKREEQHHKTKKDKAKQKLERRLAQAEDEENDPSKRAARVAANVPRTLENTREFDPSIHSTGGPSTSTGESSLDAEAVYDLANDPFAGYFNPLPSDPNDPNSPPLPPKILITTGPKACKDTYEFCDELVGVFPGSEFIRRKRGKGFELGKIAGWCAKRGYSDLMVVNEDHKTPNAITLIHLPNGPTAYFKLTSIQLSQAITGHARPTPHTPELILNNFATRLGHHVGRMFQSLFPHVPEFEGRQAVTLHVQRDFIFFRRHRYMFKNTERTALQEIGPRFTLKLRWLKKGTPAVGTAGAVAKKLMTAAEEDEEEAKKKVEGGEQRDVDVKGQEEFEWMWKPELETSRRKFFL
uniref:Brix domain-containing protein n=1 Tax=Bartheletia paradoxa TaxID=669517 RepID=A0A2D0XHQ1_9BASI|nr:hypothetical protein SPAR05813 [Bartheletia paradoxa]